MPPRTSKPLHERILAAMEPAKPSLSSLYDCLIKEGNEPVAVEKDPASLIDGLGYTLLHRAVLDGYSELIPILIDNYNVPVNSTSELGDTALHRACFLGQRECVELLLNRYNAMINVKNKRGWTPLHFAAANGHDNIVQLLLAHESCDPMIKSNDFHDTPLHVAARKANSKVLELLVDDPRVDKNARNKEHKTPAEMTNREECRRALQLDHS
eukprot:gb/GECG01001687.1/.p1 GENE.gb/GECG01001687.1/~~gb/GECG01001687.1/.p1  ORF type:complete len:212 (+),score=18.78 gb/GECG01001687.1/:1-636(+)